MTTKHTSGPWVLNPLALWQVCTEDANLVAEVYGNGPDETLANAHAIKAVPRMLVALQECHAILSTFAAAVAPPPEVDDAIDNAARAIEEATATGRWA